MRATLKTFNPIKLVDAIATACDIPTDHVTMHFIKTSPTSIHIDVDVKATEDGDWESYTEIVDFADYTTLDFTHYIAAIKSILVDG